MLLGAVDVTPLEAAQLYNGLANGGFQQPAARGARGDRRRRQGAEGLPAAGDAGGAARRRYQLDRMMVQVMEHGTGRAARALLPRGPRGRGQVRHLV